MMRPLQWRPARQRVRGPRGARSRPHGERASGTDPCDGERRRGRLARLHETRACTIALQGDGEAPLGPVF
jgi:hypothetical protein